MSTLDGTGDRRGALPTGWATDFDLYDPDYVDDPFPIWSAMRAECPVAISGRRGGAVLPVRHADIAAIARDPATFSNRALEATGPVPREGSGLRIPPLSSDPPLHTAERRILLPLFSRAAIARFEPLTERIATDLVDGIVGRDRVDAALDYAQHIPVVVISSMLGVPAADVPRFTGWIVEFLKEGQRGQERRLRAIDTISSYFTDFVHGNTAPVPGGGDRESAGPAGARGAER